MLDFFSDYSKQLQLEKLVIGLEEPIFIKGIGNFIAKVDSGNGGYNVIHGEDVYQNGGVIIFKTYTEDNELKQVSKKLLQYINVNIGSGKVEQRPVIELDVKFGDEEYEKVPFSIANRSSNKNKVLICKDFIQHQLNALIDVGGNMLSDQKVEVKYITEANLGAGFAAHTFSGGQSASPAEIIQGMQQLGKDMANGIAKGAKWTREKGKKGLVALGKGGWKGAKWATKNTVGRLAKKANKAAKEKGGWLHAIGSGLQGAGKYTDIVIDELGEAVKAAKDYDNIADEDLQLILKKSGKSINDVLAFKLTDYYGKYYGGGEKPVKAEQENFNIFHGILKKTSNIDQQVGQEDQAKINKQATTAQDKGTDQPAQAATRGATPPAAKTDQSQPPPNTTDQSLVKAESYEYKLAKLILEAEKNVTGKTGSTSPTPGQGTTQTQTQPNSNSKSPEEQADPNNQITDEEKKKIAELRKLYAEKRKYFFVWFIKLDKNIKSNKAELDREVKVLNKQNNFVNIVNNLFANNIKEKDLQFSSRKGNTEINDNLINKVNYLLNSDLMPKAVNAFAICYGNLGKRKIYYAVKDKSQEEVAKTAPDQSKETLKQKLNQEWAENELLKSLPLENETVQKSLPTIQNKLEHRINELNEKSREMEGER